MFARNLDYFFVVSECKSITAAAEKLFISPSALLQQMNKLESDTGLKLFERDSKGVYLSQAGEIFLKGMRGICEQYDALLNECKRSEDSRKKIRIGAISNLVPDLFTKVSAAFSARYPDISQEPVMDTEEKLFAMLDAGRIDLIEYYDCPNAHKYSRQYFPVVSEGRDCLLSPHHSLAKLTEIKPEDLAPFDVLVYQFERIPGFREYMQENYPQVRLNERRQPTDLYSVIRSFEDGHVGLVPPHCAKSFAPLVNIPFKVDMKWTVGFVYRKENEQALMNYLNIAREVFA